MWLQLLADYSDELLETSGVVLVISSAITGENTALIKMIMIQSEWLRMYWLGNNTSPICGTSHSHLMSMDVFACARVYNVYFVRQ